MIGRRESARRSASGKHSHTATSIMFLELLNNFYACMTTDFSVPCVFMQFKTLRAIVVLFGVLWLAGC